MAIEEGSAARLAPAALAVVLLLIAGCADRRAEFAGVPTVVGDSLVRFPSGLEVATGLSRVSYIGQLPTESSPPILILEGSECSDCGVLPSVLLWQPADGRVDGLAGHRGAYLYPGRIVSADDGHTVLSESRLFWGECMSRQPPGLVQYLTDYSLGDPGPARHLSATVVVGDSLESTAVYLSVRELTYTLAQVQDRRCFEIPRREMVAPL